jgi:hypothetical protein
MPPTTTQDEDLLIISDDMHTDTSPIFLDDVLTAPSNIDTNSSLISEYISTPVMDSLKTVSFDEPVVIGTPVSETTSFDFSTLTETSITPHSPLSEISTVEEVPVSGTPIDIFDMGTPSETPTVSEIVTPALAVGITPPILTPVSSEGMGEDLNVIISETIAKLENRKMTIASERDGKKQQVQDLKTQMSALEEEVALHEAEIDTLSAESEKITRNITQLEKMKLGDDEVTKEHNAKRIVKK